MHVIFVCSKIRVPHLIETSKSESPILLLQGVFEGNVIKLITLAGETRCAFELDAPGNLTALQMRAAVALRRPRNKFDVILPNGDQLSKLVQ